MGTERESRGGPRTVSLLLQRCFAKVKSSPVPLRVSNRNDAALSVHLLNRSFEAGWLFLLPRREETIESEFDPGIDENVGRIGFEPYVLFVEELRKRYRKYRNGPEPCCTRKTQTKRYGFAFAVLSLRSCREEASTGRTAGRGLVKLPSDPQPFRSQVRCNLKGTFRGDHIALLSQGNPKPEPGIGKFRL